MRHFGLKTTVLILVSWSLPEEWGFLTFLAFVIMIFFEDLATLVDRLLEKEEDN